MRRRHTAIQPPAVNHRPPSAGPRRGRGSGPPGGERARHGLPHTGLAVGDLVFHLPHLRSGRLVPDQTVVSGIENVVDAFLAVLRGGTTGKMIVQVGDSGEK
ncbi:MAG TPA: hypothetical protein VGL02_31500 [Streptomyces sp.]